ncbi:MAG: hypothetical protein JWP97_747 [Labilithrix sp.]|nr:hypothetical protein [Labilithrix sp.]
MKEINVGVRSTLGLVALALITAAAACSSPDEAGTSGASSGEEAVGSDTVSQPIVNGTSASAYEEAALVDGPDFYCSGAVIAPRLVLTAGHCVAGVSSWTVKAPYASNQTAHGSSSWTGYVQTGDYVNPDTLDVAVIILDTPINLTKYPKLASAKAADGTKAVNVGRIRNNKVSTTGLYVGAPVTLTDGKADGFPFSYSAKEIIESGDSGGPVYTGSGTSRTLAAVNSGGGGGEILARVDLAYAKIQSLIAANGGSGSSSSSSSSSGGSSSGGSSSGGSSSGGSSSSSSGGSSSSSGGTTACTGTHESEPNDDSNHPDALSGTRCGTLATGDDVDWFSWSAAKGATYDLTLTASGDADILMWKNTGSGWSQVTNQSPTHFAAKASSAGNYLVAVRSSGQDAQSYGLKLTK